MTGSHDVHVRPAPNRHGHSCLGLLLLAVWLVFAQQAHARNVSVPCSTGTTTVTIPPVLVSPTAATGTLIGSPGTATASFSCPSSGYGNPWYYVYLNGALVTVSTPGVRNPAINNLPYITLQPLTTGSPTQTTISGRSGYLYSTNLSGVSLLLSWPAPNNTSYGGLNTLYAFSTGATVTFTAQLVKTGTITAGTVTSPSQLMNFANYTSGITNGSSTYGSLVVSPTTVTVSACSVNTSSQNMTVTLPTIDTSALASAGATAGRTPFNIGLTCAGSGFNVLVTMATNNAYAGANGVVAPTTGAGYASNVGVQILNGQHSPITFNVAQKIGAVTSTMTAPYYAQYYATGTPVGSGKVIGTVTFNLSYQ